MVDKHPLPNIEEMFSNLRGAKYFSKLDLKSAYHQLELHPDSRDITTFITYEGLFRYKRVCFGLASAPACFQKLMTNVLRGLCGVMCFIDDIIIYGSSKEEHYTNLCNVLKRLQECGMVLNDKCIFEAQSIQVLGHVIDQTGLHPNPDLVAAIRDAPTPTSKEQVRSFLGLAGYYARFVPNFATKVQPIRDLQTASQFAWNAEASAAFQEIKSAIVNSEALSLFDPNLDVCITTDASGYGIGAIMTQMIDGQERIVSCISRKLSEAERKYSTGEREALACVWAIERWHTYLWGRHFTLRTDHQALVTLLSTSGTGHRPMRIARWGSRLLHYNFTVEYKPGNQNKVSDALSRLPLDSDNLQLQIDEDVHAVCEIVLNDSCITKEQLREATNADVLLKEVSKYMISGWPKKSSDVSAEILPYFRIRESLSIHHDIVFKGERVVIPSELVKRIIQFGHEGHQGIIRTKQRLRQLYWWPNMDDVIMQTIKDCTVCQNHDKTARVRTAPMQPVPLPTSSWKKLAIDIVDPYSTASCDCRFSVTLID